MDFVFSDLRHLPHVPQSGLKVLAGRRFGVISGHLDHRRHQGSHFAISMFAIIWLAHRSTISTALTSRLCGVCMLEMTDRCV
jgi:hypothetical protein